AIAPLAALGLASDDDPTGLLHDGHSGFDLIHVLAAFASAAKGVDLQISRVNLERGGIGDLRDNIDAGKRGVTPVVCIEGRNPYEPMHSSLGLKMSISVLPDYEHRRPCSANSFTLLSGPCFSFETAALGPAPIQAPQDVRRRGRSCAACGGMT